MDPLSRGPAPGCPASKEQEERAWTPCPGGTHLGVPLPTPSPHPGQAVGCRPAGKYLQDEDEVVHWPAALVQVVVGSQAVALIKPYFLVDTGMLQQVQKDLLRDPQRAEDVHLCPTVGKRDGDTVLWAQHSPRQHTTARLGSPSLPDTHRTRLSVAGRGQPPSGEPRY